MESNEAQTQQDHAAELAHVKKLLSQVLTQLKTLQFNHDKIPDPWIDLKTACAMKGIRYSSLTSKAQSWRRPLNGKPEAIINGRDHWRPQTIASWIMQDDEALAEHDARND